MTGYPYFNSKGEGMLDTIIDLLLGSSWPEPNLGGRRKSCIELVVEVSNPLIVVLVFALVERVSGVSPPSVKEEAEEERHDESGVKAVGVGIKDAVSLEGSSGSPESAVGGKISCFRNQT